jgi:hypothetical protein
VNVGKGMMSIHVVFAVSQKDCPEMTIGRSGAGNALSYCQFPFRVFAVVRMACLSGCDKRHGALCAGGVSILRQSLLGWVFSDCISRFSPATNASQESPDGSISFPDGAVMRNAV